MDKSELVIGGDLKVGRIGYGAMRLTGPGLWGAYRDHEAGLATLRGVVDAGVTLIDTADVYGPHTNELLIREALWPYPKHLVIATKGGFVRGAPELSSIAAIGHPEYLRQSARLSARRLGVECIDLYYLHSGRAVDTPFADQVAALAQLRQEGVIRHIGLSNVTVDQLAEAARIAPIAAVTAHFNIAARGQAPLVRAALETGAVFCPWQPVSLTRPGDPTDTNGTAELRRALAPIAERHEATIPQIALAWLLAYAPNCLPVPATTDLAHLHDNLRARELTLSAEDVAVLNACGDPA
jgi:aryl-alcohol dehydrogenase-like predicted oxidoreductase